MLYIVSYDIPNDRRRTKLARILKDFGTRVQYSVFECRLRERQLQKMLARVRKLIDPKEDRVRVYGLCADCADRVIVEGENALPPWEEEDFIIL